VNVESEDWLLLLLGDVSKEVRQFRRCYCCYFSKLNENKRLLLSIQGPVNK
jgi:hypothetical protein